MRLWSLHPRYLDRQGLLAAWREGLLAQKVLVGATRGYRHHPQLERFRSSPDPTAAITTYLHALADEAAARGYRFDRDRITRVDTKPATLVVTSGQLDFEGDHLRLKLALRDPDRLADLPTRPDPHPSFRVVEGSVEPWERGREKG